MKHVEYLAFCRASLVLVLAASCAVACRPAAKYSKQMGQGANHPTRTAEQRAASARQEIAQGNTFYSDLFQQSYVTALASLPLSAQVPDARMPWDIYGYPFNKGGTTVQWTNAQGQSVPSALTKYDLAFSNGTGKQTAWEFSHHGDPQSANWNGHCNGAAAAVSRHAEPMHAVTINGVTFDTHDIKALLAEVYMSAKVRFVSGTRCDKAESWFSKGPADRTIPTVMGPCEDTNPGSFFVALANVIGRAGYPVIVDRYALGEVWNLPVFGYRASVTSITRREASRLVTGNALDQWIFNPEASGFASVDLTVNVVNTSLFREPFQGVPPTRTSATRTYSFVLELDSAGAIIGGEWIGASQQDHPDFAWMPFEPAAATNDTFSANPFVDSAQVFRLWALSRDLDPANAPALLAAPNDGYSWGLTDDFQVMLDGRSDGDVFLGQNASLSLTPLHGTALSSVIIDVNGAGATAYSTGMQGLTFHAGVNVITIHWESSAGVSGTREAKFLVWGVATAE